MAKATIKTAANIYRELAKIIPDGCKAYAGRAVNQQYNRFGRTQSTSYYGCIYWTCPPDGLGQLSAHGTGKTAAIAFRETLADLRKQLAARKLQSPLIEPAEDEGEAPRLEHVVRRIGHAG